MMIVICQNLRAFRENMPEPGLMSKWGIEGARRGNNYRLPWKPFFVRRHLGVAVFFFSQARESLLKNKQIINAKYTCRWIFCSWIAMVLFILIFGSCVEWTGYILRHAYVTNRCDGDGRKARQRVVRTSFKNLPWLFRIMLCIRFSFVKPFVMM